MSKKASKKKTTRKKAAKKKTARKARTKKLADITQPAHPADQALELSPFTTPAEKHYRSLLLKIKNERHRRFVENYVQHPNGTVAAARAGFSENGAAVTASQLLRNPNISEAIEAGFLAIRERSHITRQRIEDEYAKIGFSNLADYLTFGPNGVTLKNSDDINIAKLAAVAEVTETTSQFGGSIKFKLIDKKGALDSLSRIHGLFKDKITIETDPVGDLLKAIDGSSAGFKTRSE